MDGEAQQEDGWINGRTMKEGVGERACRKGWKEWERETGKRRETVSQNCKQEWLNKKMGIHDKAKRRVWSLSPLTLSLSPSLWCCSVCCRRIHFRHDVTSCLALFQSPLLRFHSIMHHTNIKTHTHDYWLYSQVTKMCTQIISVSNWDICLFLIFLKYTQYSALTTLLFAVIHNDDPTTAELARWLTDPPDSDDNKEQDHRGPSLNLYKAQPQLRRLWPGRVTGHALIPNTSVSK